MNDSIFTEDSIFFDDRDDDRELFDRVRDEVYGQYEDLVTYTEIEVDFPIHFPNQVSRDPEDFREDLEPFNDDFWDSDPFFWSVTSEEDFKKLEELMIDAEAKADAQDQDFLEWERAPLRHFKKKH